MTDLPLSPKEQVLLVDLCSSIQEWQKTYENNYSEDTSNIDWSSVSNLMKEKGHTISNADCCQKWKYLAYGKVIKSQNPLEVSSDDEEAFYQPLTAYKRFKEIREPIDASKTSTDISVLLHKQPGDLPSAARVRLQSRRIKFLVPEQIPSGASNLHIPVFSGEYAFEAVKLRSVDPPPLVSTVSQSSPHYKQYQESNVFSRPYTSSGNRPVKVESVEAKKNYYLYNKERDRLAATAAAAAASRGTSSGTPSAAALAAVPNGPAPTVRYLPINQVRPVVLPTAILPNTTSTTAAVTPANSSGNSNINARSTPLSFPTTPPSVSSNSNNKRKAEEIIL